MSTISLRHTLFILLVLCNSTTVLLTKYSRDGVSKGDLYVLNHLLITTEIFKLLLSCCLECIETKGHLVGSLATHVFQTPHDSFIVAGPSIMYVFENTFIYDAIANLSVSMFQVIYQSKLLTTAIMSVILLNREYSTKQWICLATLGFGVSVVIVGEGIQNDAGIFVDDDRTNPSGKFFTQGIFSAFAACFCSACAGVFFEKALKKNMEQKESRKPASMWMRNMQMAYFSIIAGCIQFLRLSGDDIKKDFLHGFNSRVWCLVIVQAVGGLLNAAIIKYADNVLKGMATGVSLIFSTASGMIIFKTPLTFHYVLGSTIILSSVYFFNNRLPCIKSSIQSGENDLVKGHLP